LRLELGAGAVDRSHLRGQLERHPLLFKNTLELPRNFSIDSRQNAVQELNDVHLRAQSPPDRAKLEPDHAGADDQQLLRHLAEHQCAGGRNDALFVDRNPFEAGDIGAAGDDDVLGLHRLGLAVSSFHLNPPGRRNPSDSLDRVDLVFLEQEGDALDVAVDGFVLEFHHGAEVELGLVDADAHAAKLVASFVEQF
jgi:hypothetical protein